VGGEYAPTNEDLDTSIISSLLFDSNAAPGAEGDVWKDMLGDEPRPMHVSPLRAGSGLSVFDGERRLEPVAWSSSLIWMHALCTSVQLA
jgi:hypothetical protein